MAMMAKRDYLAMSSFTMPKYTRVPSMIPPFPSGPVRKIDQMTCHPGERRARSSLQVCAIDAHMRHLQSVMAQAGMPWRGGCLSLITANEFRRRPLGIGSRRWSLT